MTEDLITRLRAADAKRAECTAHKGPHTILGEAAAALEKLVYEDKGHFYCAVHGDWDVTYIINP